MLDPFGVGFAVGEVAGDLFVVHDEAAGGVDAEDLAGAEASFFDDAAFVVVDAAHFAGADDKTVVEDHVACRAQAVPIQNRAYDAPVGVGDGGGAVPRFHERAVVLVEGAAFRANLLFGQPFPRFGDHHHQGVAHVASAAHEQFQRVVQFGTVAAVHADDGIEIFDVVAPVGVGQIVGARHHPVDIAFQRVDLAVVADQAEGLGTFPGGEGVGAVALVEDRNRRLVVGIVQIRIEMFQFLRQHQSFVDDGAAAQAGNVKTLHAFGP